MDSISLCKKISEWQSKKTDSQYSSKEIVDMADELFKEIKIELFDLLDDGR